MRDWSEIDEVYEKLVNTYYPQPQDEGHTAAAKVAVEWFLQRASIASLADIGCGEGFCADFFEPRGISYVGFALGEDVRVAQSKGRNVYEADFNFLPAGFTADAGLLRHSLEHSLFPHITLSLLHRVVTKYLFIVLPSLEWYRAGIKGSNHFNVLSMEQWQALFTHTGWKVKDSFVTWRNGNPVRYAPDERTQDEYWFLLKDEKLEDK